MHRTFDTLRAALSLFVATLIAATSVTLCPCEDAAAVEEAVPSCCAGHVVAPEGADAAAAVPVDEHPAGHHTDGDCPHCDKAQYVARAELAGPAPAVLVDGPPTLLAFHTQTPWRSAPPRLVATGNHDPPATRAALPPPHLRLHARVQVWRC